MKLEDAKLLVNSGYTVAVKLNSATKPYSNSNGNWANQDRNDTVFLGDITSDDEVILLTKYGEIATYIYPRHIELTDTAIYHLEKSGFPMDKITLPLSKSVAKTATPKDSSLSYRELIELRLEIYKANQSKSASALKEIEKWILGK